MRFLFSKRFRALSAVAATCMIVATNAVSQDKESPDDIQNQSQQDFAKQAREDFISFKDSVKQDYGSFRDSVNREYAEFMRTPWTAIKIEKHIDAPINKEPEPDVEPAEETNKPIIKSSPIKIEEVVEIRYPLPQPEPIGPIIQIEGTPKLKDKDIQFTYYGTPFTIRQADLASFQLYGNDENAFADGWETLSQYTTNHLILDCLKARNDLCLPDWGYITMLEMVSRRLAGDNINEQRLLQGFLLNQSGYKVRFCYDDQKKLHVLIASPGIIYGRSRYHLDDDWYYSYTQPSGNQVNICNFTTPGEKAIDLGINKAPLFTFSPCETREIKVERHPDVTLSITPNKNLIEFYNDYPQCTLDNSPISMWVIQGNTPVSKETKEQLYPALKQAVAGKSQYESLQFLLKVAQSFPYGHDDEIWGRDRAFWMDESWAYPKSDCEDHAVNFSHMVRDILGLDVCLIHYPGHLSTCVNLSDDNIPGDYIMHEGKKYIVCDPTFFYSNVGKTAPSNNNAEAILIPLRKVN